MSANIVARLQELQEWFLLNQVGNKVIYIAGFFIFMALLVVLLAKKIKVPIVVGYVFLGILLSVNIIEWMPFLTPAQKEWYAFTLENLDYITQIALGFIAFTIGSELSITTLKKMGTSIILIVLFEAVGGFALVTLSILALGKPLYLALLLGGIASATAPAATVMVLNEYNAEGPLTSMIMAVVGIDDALALIIFSLIRPMALIQYSGTGSMDIFNVFIKPLAEIIGSIGLGLLIGFISQYFQVSFEDKTKKILTMVATIVGSSAIAISFHLSPLITNMSVGFAYRNFARRNPGIADFMDTLTVPLYAVFFILAGTEIRFASIASGSFLLLALIYITARIIGKVGGASLAAWITNAPDKIKKYVGLGLFPQSGVAIALAYTVQQQFTGGETNVGLLVFNTLLFTAAMTEVIGPFATKYAIFQAGEASESGEKARN